MGKVWLEAEEVGTFEPQTVGTTGTAYLDTSNIGTFTLAASGDVLLEAVDIGDYEALGGSPPPISQAQDARYRTRVYLSTYLDAPSLTKDDDVSLAPYTVIFAKPNYPIIKEFIDLANDIIFFVGEPVSEPLLNTDQVPYGYEEHVPITIMTVDKPDCTGTKLKWKAEAEIRRICETYPTGSQRSLEKREGEDLLIGRVVAYQTILIMSYRRNTT